MNNALLYLGGILITALAVLFAVPRFVDWNSYRGIFEEEATRILGREVRVGGDVNLRLLPAPFVSFEKIRIADAGDDGGNSIIRAESFTMWLSVPPLLRGMLEAHKVELRRPVINLAINAEGSGNWRTLAVTPGTLPFAPKDVALQSVAIQNGAVIVAGPSHDELARFDAINGELNAEALEGPYKFKGTVSWDGALRHLKLATAKRDANGDLRFKAAVDVAGSANAYVLDAKLSDLTGAPTLDGDLTAKLNLGSEAKPASSEPADLAVAPAPPPEPNAPPDNTAPSAPSATAGGAKGFELKSKVKGTALGVALEDLSVSLEAGATPQLITGRARFGWAGKTELDVSLASRWLDLDQLARTSEPRMPLEAARSYFEALAAALPAAADTNALLEFDQLTLGGEPISNVRLAAARSGGPLELKGVRADLPGGVRLDLDGVLTPGAKVPSLDGTLFVSGKSLMRFLAWGLSQPEMARERADGPFSLDGRFALGNGTLALTEATVDFSGTPVEGSLTLDLGERRKIAIAIEGPRIDVAQFGAGVVDLARLRRILFGTDAAGAASAQAPPQAEGAAFDPAGSDLALDLKVAELVDGARTLEDIDLDIRLERGALSIPRLRFATPEGLSIDAEGEATDVPANPKGAIRGLVSAPSAEAARAFVALLGAGDGADDLLGRIAGLAPLRLAGTLELAGGATNAQSLRVDGTLGGGRFAASLRLDGGRAQWRTAPLDLQATADSPDLAKLITALSGVAIGGSGASPPGGDGRLVIKAAGVPAEGLLAFADAKADGLSIGYRGEVRLAKPGETDLDGALEIAVSDARIALALAGLRVAEGAAGVPLDGSIGVRRTGSVLRLESEAVRLGASTVSGHATLAAGENGRTTIDASLAADKASFALLLAPLLGASEASNVLATLTPPAAGGAAEAPAAEAIWPERAFDLGLLDRVDGQIALAIGALGLEPGLTLGNARLAAELSPQGIKVTRFESEAVGGRLSAALDMTRAPAGIGLAGKVRIDVSSKPAAEGEARPGDTAAFAVTFSSRALSPAALMAAMSGSGELTVGDATLNGNSPAAVSQVARAALTGQGPSGGAALAEAIGAALKEGEVNLGKLTIPVEISDGALKLKKVQVEMADGRSSFVTVVELATMRLDSEWQIAPKLDKGLAADPARALLPPVTVVYTGKLSELASLAPRVSAGALERELVVRKMEIDVGELERLRKLDEARARKDAERRKADEARARLEEERRKAAEEDQAQPWTATPQPGADAVERERLPAPPDSTADPQRGVPIEEDIEAAAPPAPASAPSPTSQRQRRAPPPKDAWKPFQISPY
jgi:uncharacterized protein involved in outer membrane biogenesis